MLILDQDVWIFDEKSMFYLVCVSVLFLYHDLLIINHEIIFPKHLKIRDRSKSFPFAGLNVFGCKHWKCSSELLVWSTDRCTCCIEAAVSDVGSSEVHSDLYVSPVVIFFFFCKCSLNTDNLIFVFLYFYSHSLDLFCIYMVPYCL